MMHLFRSHLVRRVQCTFQRSWPLLRHHLDIHAIEKSSKGRLVDDDVLSDLGYRRRQGERAAVQALVTQHRLQALPTRRHVLYA